MEINEYSIEIGGKTLTAQFNNIADQSHGSCIVRMGNTVVLATAVMSKKPIDANFFPLRVDYEERFYAAGQILGSRFVRREGKPSEEAVLSGRVVDRTIRPLFNQKMRHEVQVVVTILSIGEDDPDVLAVLASSLALSTSHIPWNGPVSAIRIGKMGGAELIINPTYTSRKGETEMDILCCGKDNLVNMIEVGSKEVNENRVIDGLKKAIEEIERLQEWQKKIIQEIGKTKIEVTQKEIPKEIETLFNTHIRPTLKEDAFGEAGKGKLNAVASTWEALVKEHLGETQTSEALEYFDEALNNLLHEEAIHNNSRADGRKLHEIRPLYAQAGGISDTLHGTGVFFRGGTHVLSVLTLGGPEDTQVVEGMEEQSNKRFFHHYNFPPYSTGEVGRVGGFNRREIGHGALAEKAIEAVLPPLDQFPYTIRIVSEALASNGSTSMASVCGSTLALMDAGVPIKNPVAGIAMGLMYENDKKYAILTDIQGPEDHHGDMDFKVAGTREGVTAVQMDVKVLGVPIHILEEAFSLAKNARLQILDVIESHIPIPRKEISSYAPRIVSMKVRPEQIGMVIGSGGKTINEIKSVTKVKEITIEDDGTIFISSTNKDPQAAAEAKTMIESITREYKAGDRVEGIVEKVLDFGAIVRFGPNADGLVHISEVAPFRIEKISTVLEPGEKIPVIVKGVDERGRIKLSLKEADPDFAKRKIGNV
jgi:polyribonucleotide nucleotidyltransferase